MHLCVTQMAQFFHKQTFYSVMREIIIEIQYTILRVHRNVLTRRSAGRWREHSLLVFFSICVRRNVLMVRVLLWCARSLNVHFCAVCSQTVFVAMITGHWRNCDKIMKQNELTLVDSRSNAQRAHTHTHTQMNWEHLCRNQRIAGGSSFFPSVRILFAFR